MIYAFYAALGQVAELSIALMSDAGRVTALHQQLSRAVARLRASVEAMSPGSPYAREAKDSFMAMLAVIEQRVGTTFSSGADVRPCADLCLFVDGELEADRAMAYRRHLETCETCRAGVLRAQQLAARLSERKEPT
jgi:hypothetical protein